MSIIFEKDGQKMGVLDEVQASAFVKNGWTKVEEVAIELEKEPIEMEEKTANEDVEEDVKPEEATKGAKGAKK